MLAPAARGSPGAPLTYLSAEGEAGLQDRSSRPQHSPRRTSPAAEAAVVAARRTHRRGPDWLAVISRSIRGIAWAVPRTCGSPWSVPYPRHRAGRHAWSNRVSADPLTSPRHFLEAR
jgi:hypothetical protein